MRIPNNKVYLVQSEGDMEAVMERFFELRRTKAKKKSLSVVVPSSGFSSILAANLTDMLMTRNMGDPRNYHVHICVRDETWG